MQTPVAIFLKLLIAAIVCIHVPSKASASEDSQSSLSALREARRAEALALIEKASASPVLSKISQNFQFESLFAQLHDALSVAVLKTGSNPCVEMRASAYVSVYDNSTIYICDSKSSPLTAATLIHEATHLAGIKNELQASALEVAIVILAGEQPDFNGYLERDLPNTPILTNFRKLQKLVLDDKQEKIIETGSTISLVMTKPELREAKSSSGLLLKENGQLNFAGYCSLQTQVSEKILVVENLALIAMLEKNIGKNFKATTVSRYFEPQSPMKNKVFVQFSNGTDNFFVRCEEGLVVTTEKRFRSMLSSIFDVR